MLNVDAVSSVLSSVSFNFSVPPKSYILYISIIKRRHLSFSQTQWRSLEFGKRKGKKGCVCVFKSHHRHTKGGERERERERRCWEGEYE